jgi:hypothetical protein
MKRVNGGSVLAAPRAVRAGALALLALLLLAQAALAQEIPEWVPQPKLDPVIAWAKRILGVIIWAVSLLTLFVLLVKWMYGHAVARTGVPGVSTRGYTEAWEALSGFIWFFIALIVPAWIAFFASLANLLPPWLASQISDIFIGFWRDLFGLVGGK